jgi:hypothetical protein
LTITVLKKENTDTFHFRLLEAALEEEVLPPFLPLPRPQRQRPRLRRALPLLEVVAVALVLRSGPSVEALDGQVPRAARVRPARTPMRGTRSVYKTSAACE